MNQTGKQPPKMKKKYNPLMFVGEAFKNLWRDRAMSLASILVLASCLILLGCFALIVLNINVNMEKLADLNTLVVFADYDLTSEEVKEIGSKLEKLDNVSSVEFISKSDGLESMKEDQPDFSDIFDEMNNNGDNPLPDSFKIKYNDVSKVTTLDYNIRQIEGVMKVKNRSDLAVTLENVKNGISVVLIGFFAVLFIVSVFIIINTIKLAVNSHMEEIRVMKYIGASDWFIVVPYMIEGTIIGIFAGGIAYICQWYIYYSLEKMVVSDMPMLELVSFDSIGGIVALAFVAMGIFTGIIGSCISLRKNLQA
ncbi:MAG: permease-like cell division protein FtsX [Clostridia bacterium]|nr:permease-like cell division protein FtsX [Clostridia bacterium]